MLTAWIEAGAVRWEGALPKGCRSAHLQYLDEKGGWFQQTSTPMSIAKIKATLNCGPWRHRAYRLIACAGSTLEEILAADTDNGQPPALGGASKGEKRGIAPGASRRKGRK